MNNKFISFSKQYTIQIKGIAILFMMYHHLFVNPNKLHYTYKSLLISSDYNYQINIAWFTNLCVAIFIFLSGFGLSTIGKNYHFNIKYIYCRLKNLYFNYWSVFILLIPFGFINHYNFSLITFIYNLSGFSSSYCSEWWFIRLYIEFILLFPLIKDIDINKSIVVIITYFILKNFESTITESFAHQWLIKETIRIMNWFPIYIVGIISAKNNLFSKYQQFFFKYNQNINLCSFILLILLALFRYYISRNTTSFDFLIAPLFIFASINLINYLHIGTFLEYFGKRSTALWLVHPFFCYYYFQKMTFLPYYSLLIYLWLILLSLGVTYITNYIYQYLNCIPNILKDHENTTNK